MVYASRISWPAANWLCTFWERPSRALPEPKTCPASDASRPPVGAASTTALASHPLLLGPSARWIERTLTGLAAAS
jgi:hypothetical protein